MKHNCILRIIGVCLASIIMISCMTNEPRNDISPIVSSYEDLTIIDAHNHDASKSIESSMTVWNRYGIDKIVLFGNISEPSAISTDHNAYNAYLKYPDRFIPFIAGINIFDPKCIDYITERFDSGACGIGEIVAVSKYSPMTSHLPWKGNEPLDGYLPQVYELCAKYKKPILLHIDPPDDLQTDKLIKAALQFPNTSYIFAHANAYSAISLLKRVLESTNNIYIDFFAGFTAYNPDSSYKLNDYVPLINEYPQRFVVSTDSGYGIGYDQAYSAIYQLLDLLDKDIAIQIAGKNLLYLINEKG